MKINGKYYRSIWRSEKGVHIFDQRKLPWELDIVALTSAEEAARAIREMWTRGAPLLAMTGAYGLAMALEEDASNASLEKNYAMLLATRPTAVNLKWALDEIVKTVKPLSEKERATAGFKRADALCDEDVEINKSIGKFGLEIIRGFAKSKKAPVNILTHCNAGWLATVDYGTALSPVYMAHDEGIPVHVWVDETRPRNQGALLTAYELAQHGVPHTVITDNAGGLLMQRGQVDFCIVGADRVTRNGDVCNKVGTYLKALAAKDNNIPFYVALPYTTFDYRLESGDEIPIEERSEEEVTMITGQGTDGRIFSLKLTGSPASNPAFDITPARLVSAYVTEKGIVEKLGGNHSNLKQIQR